MRRLAPVIVILFFVLTAATLWPQAEKERGNDPASFIGLTLAELIRVFGVPNSVFAVRGLEEWQDDVVFAYDESDFCVYRDRVWQVGLREARGVKLGDSKGVVSLVLGPGAQTGGDSVFYPLYEASWPMMLRCDFDEAGRVKAIFIYRTDL